MSGVTEFELIASLEPFLAADGPGVPVGVGDDAAVVEIAGTPVAVAVDALVDTIHFDLTISSPADVGWKALAANVSDLAAIGARTVAAVAAITVPEDHQDEVRELYEGMAEAAEAWSVRLVGGDTTGGPVLSVSVTVLGEVHPGGPVRRDGARPGDVVVVAGPLGEAAAGLALARADATTVLERHADLLRAHRRPVPLVTEGLALAAAGGTACVDVSDGLGQDLGHVARRSSVRIDLDEVPLSDAVVDAASALGVDPVGLAVSGGDDLALAATIPEEHVGRLDVAWRRIGRVVEGGGVWLEGRDVSSWGWQHGRPGR